VIVGRAPNRDGERVVVPNLAGMAKTSVVPSLDAATFRIAL
jgi:hypothetical protein